jgi:hypothetical protein
MTLIRYRDEIGEYLLRDPEVQESSRGPYFNAYYSVVTPRGVRPVQFGGHFPLREALLIEPADEQLEMAA